MTPTRVFLSVQPVGHRRPAGAGPWYRETRPPRYRASWWTRGTSTELYQSKTVASREEAVRLARRWLERRNKEAVGRPIDTSLIDTTDQPERFGYAHERKSTAQLNNEIAAALAKEEP